MPAYSFEALSANGETRKGIIDADSARSAVRRRYYAGKAA